MKSKELAASYFLTGENVIVIKVKRDEGVRYIVFWKNEPEPTVYPASEFAKYFALPELE